MTPASRIFGALVALGLIAAHGGDQAKVWQMTLAPGIDYRVEESFGDRAVFSLRVDHRALTGNPGDLRVSPELAGGTIEEPGSNGRQTPTQIRAATGAVAAINGDFFGVTGAPIGFMVRGGELISTPIRSRTVFGWGKTAGFGACSWDGQVRLPSGAQSLDQVNQPTGQNQLVLDTPAVGMTTVAPDGVAIVVRPTLPILTTDYHGVALVERLAAPGEAIQPKGEFVLSARGKKAALLQAVQVGDMVTLDVHVRGFDWSQVDSVISGGPLLVRKGRVAVDATEEGFNADFQKRHPRSAVGITASGNLVIAAVDGRQATSRGMTLEEMASQMIALGCVDAMNLDGGGSTCLNIEGIVVNRPSDGVERAVANALVIYGSAPLSGVALPTIVSPATITVGDAVKLSASGGPSGQKPIWGCTGAAWVDPDGLLSALGAGTAQVSVSVGGQVAHATVIVKPKTILPTGSDSKTGVGPA